MAQLSKKQYAAISQAITDFLKEHSNRATIRMFEVSIIADRAAAENGRLKNGEIYESLFDYTMILPAGLKTEWTDTSGTRLGTGSMYCVGNPYCQSEGINYV